jgi:hypothetical protein
MLSVKDMNGNIHEKCPRCGKDWLVLQEKPIPDRPTWMPEHIFCSDLENSEPHSCGMTACLNSRFTKEYFLHIELPDPIKDKTYTVFWINDCCTVSIKSIIEVDGIEEEIETELPFSLPLLPFNVTIDKLKIYLLFS